MVYGILRAESLREGLLLSPPSRCAENFGSGAADIALVPTAALPALTDYDIVTPYCIGAEGNVRTVVVVSDSPIGDVRRLMLDNHSLTSAALTGVLCRELWGVKPERVQMNNYSAMDKPRKGDAFLLIGDKVFDYEGRFPYSYDLAAAWRELTSLPFVFALWVARKGVPAEAVDRLQTALEYGVSHIADAIAASEHSTKSHALEYLTKNINYNLDPLKRESLALFLNKITKTAGL